MADFDAVLLKAGESVAMPSRTIQLLPTKVYILPEGDLKNRPSFVLQLCAGDRIPVVAAQLSFRMFFESLSPEALALLELEWKRLKGGE